MTAIASTSSCLITILSRLTTDDCRSSDPPQGPPHDVTIEDNTPSDSLIQPVLPSGRSSRLGRAVQRSRRSRFDQVSQHVAHQPVNRSVSRNGYRTKLLRGLHVCPRNELLTTILHQGPHAFGSRLQMKLKTNDVSFELKRLVLAGLASCESHGPFRKVERFAVPVTHQALRRKAEHAVRC